MPESLPPQLLFCNLYALLSAKRVCAEGVSRREGAALSGARRLEVLPARVGACQIQVLHFSPSQKIWSGVRQRELHLELWQVEVELL